MQYNERVWKRVYRLNESLAVQSIVLYWAITFCSWEDGAFDFREIASGLRTYSLRKPCWMSFSKYLYSSNPGSDGLGWIGSERLTHS